MVSALRRAWPIAGTADMAGRIRRNRPRPEIFGDSSDHFARPCLERILQTGGLLPPPAHEMRPRGVARLPDKQDGFSRRRRRRRGVAVSPSEKLKPPRRIRPCLASASAMLSRIGRAWPMGAANPACSAAREKALRQTSLWMISATLARPESGSFQVKASGIDAFFLAMKSFRPSSMPWSSGGAS